MLRNAKVATRLPAKDLDRARAFYLENLGLSRSNSEGGLRYVCGAGEFAIFISAGVQPARTQMGWEVEDIEATVRELRVRESSSRHMTCPAKTVDGIAEITGNYPSKGYR